MYIYIYIYILSYIDRVFRCITHSYACRNVVNTIMTNGHSSLEKYTSHTLFEMVAKGLCVRGELETEQNGNILTPSSSVYSSTSFSFSWAAQPGALRSWFSRWHLISKTLTPTNWTSCRPVLYHCLTPTCLLWASHLHPTQPVYSQGYPLISSTGWTRYLRWCISYLTARPDRRSICYSSISTLQCCWTSWMLQAGIETRLTIR